MAPLTTQFNDAKSNVEPSQQDKNEAPTCHQEVRSALDENLYLCDAGVETVLIGSYRRNVSIRRVKDVDVFCKLHALPDVDPDIGARALLNRLKTALRDQLGEDRITPQARSFQVNPTRPSSWSCCPPTTSCSAPTFRIPRVWATRSATRISSKTCPSRRRRSSWEAPSARS